MSASMLAIGLHELVAGLKAAPSRTGLGSPYPPTTRTSVPVQTEKAKALGDGAPSRLTASHESVTGSYIAPMFWARPAPLMNPPRRRSDSQSNAGHLHVPAEHLPGSSEPMSPSLGCID